jgi:hypothetical protein
MIQLFGRSVVSFPFSAFVFKGAGRFILTNEILMPVPVYLSTLRSSNFRLNLLFNINIVLLCCHI